MNKNRVAYGFALEFPQRFTMRQLANGRKVQYITLYKRVQKALQNGELIVAGKQDFTVSHKKKSKGRQQLIYQRVNAKTSTVTTEPVTA
jgi:hypothetical protein